MRLIRNIINAAHQTLIQPGSAFKNPQRLIVVIAFLTFCNGCSDQVGFQERLVSMPRHAWTHAFQPWIQLQIQDSTIPYRVYVVIRHNQQFRYENLLLRYGYIAPGDSVRYQEVNLPLAKDGRWLGDTLGTIIETRVRLGGMATKLPVGHNAFVLSHLMPDEPLTGVLQMGIRIESAGSQRMDESINNAASTSENNPVTDTSHKVGSMPFKAEKGGN